MHLVIFGLTISSSWGNGHATGGFPTAPAWKPFSVPPGSPIESQPEDEVYVCRWAPVEVPPDGPHCVYPAKPEAP